MVLLLLFVFDAVVAYVVGCWLVLRLFVRGVFVCMFYVTELLRMIVVVWWFDGGLYFCTLDVGEKPARAKTFFARQNMAENGSRARAASEAVGRSPIKRLPSFFFIIEYLLRPKRRNF